MGFQGDELVPLNELRKSFPDIAAQHARKYVGREELMQRYIPGKPWLWNDVIHFSPVHPRRVIEALVECGFSRKVKSRWFIVEPGQFNFSKSNSIIFLHNKPRALNEDFEDSEFEEYSDHACSRYTAVPEATKQYFEAVISKGGDPLMFGGIPHVLHHGVIPIKHLEVLELNS